jgi:esterase/lipase superfamily enzyme
MGKRVLEIRIGRFGKTDKWGSDGVASGGEQMAVTHWVVTNRPLDESRQRVVDQPADAWPTFRVGRFTPLTSGHGLRDKKLLEAVEASFVLSPDTHREDYADLRKERVDPKLEGSADLFHHLRLAMIRACPIREVGERASLRRASRDGAGSSEPEAIKGDTLIYIHGFDYTFAESLARLQKLHERFVLPGYSPISQIVLISWPSHGQRTQYKWDQPIAQETGIVLGRLVRKVYRYLHDVFTPPGEDVQKPQAQECMARMHLLAHSMGNQVLESMMQALELTGASTGQRTILSEVILAHADVDDDALEAGRPLSRLTQIAQRVHIYNHYSDDALMMSGSPVKNGVRRLGLEGPRDASTIPARHIVVDCTDAPFDADTPSREKRFDHWGYLDRSAVTRDICAVLRGESAASIAGRIEKRWPVFRIAGR